MASSSTCLSAVPGPWRRLAAVPAVIAALALASVAPAAAAVRAAPIAAPRVIATIRVGDGSAAVAVNPRNGTVYVVNSGSKTVSVINGRTNKVVSTIHIRESSGLARSWVVLSPKTGDLYVSNDPGNQDANGTVTVLSSRTGKLIATVPVGRFPGQGVISPVTGDVYVASKGPTGSGTVTVISGQSGKVIATIGVGSYPGQMAISPQTGEVYVPNEADGTVSVISGHTNKVTATILVDQRNSNPTNDFEPYEVAVSPVTGEVYIVSIGYHTGNIETVLDGKTNKVITTTDGSGTGAGDIVISPLTGAVYVSSDISDTATVFSGQTNNVIHSIQFAPGSGVYSAAFSPRTGDLYVPGNIKYGNDYVSSVWVVSGRTGKITAALRLRGESPGQVAVSPVTGDAYVVDSSYVPSGTPVTVSVVSG